MPRCPVCAKTDAVPLLDLGAAAVFCNVQWATRKEALAAVRGPIELAACPQCGHVFNAAFDADLIAYAPGYENSQHASTVFAGYADALVDRLVRTYGLEGRSIVDIGCGRGDLLRMLAARAGGAGYGFDPSYHGSEGGADDAVRIVREYFDAPHARDLQPGLVCCRHVLEHVPDPVAFLTQMCEALAAAGDPVLYLEVPNGTHLFRTGGVWDVLYEHYSYFSAHSLEFVLRKSGFDVLNLHEDFGAQFLCVDARVARSSNRQRLAELEKTQQAVPSDGAAHMHRRIAQWKSWAGERSGSPRATVWGAGSKGVMFLNLVGIGSDGSIDTVIDQNPAKDGRFVSGTGQRIALPSEEVLRSVGEIVLMNSIYAGEVKAKIRAMGSEAELLFADAELLRAT